eukprot:28183_1
MQEPLPQQPSPNRNPKNIPIYYQTELEYELYGNINNNSRQNNNNNNTIKKMYTIGENKNDSILADVLPNPLANPFHSDDGHNYDEHDEESTATQTGLTYNQNKYNKKYVNTKLIQIIIIMR